MNDNVRRWLACAALFALAASGCTTPEREVAPSEAAGQAAIDGCAQGADRIIERLDDFLADLPEQSPEEFLSQEETPGLDEFQTDIAEIIADTTDQRSTLCNLDGFQTLIAERLTQVETEGVLDTFLVTTILRGGELTTSDVTVAPGDDLEAIIGLLDHGSTVTFEAGIYDLDRPLIVQRDIALLGAGEADTTLRGSAADAVIVVVGRGLLRARDLTIEHVGAEQASVVVAFARPVDLSMTTLRGGVSSDDGVGGNAVVLSDDVFGGGEFDPDQPESVISDTRLVDNAGAGLVVDGALEPAISNVTVRSNQICGVCFFDVSRGNIVGGTFSENAFGIQIGDQAQVSVDGAEVTDNTVAGIVMVGTSDSTVRGVSVEGNLEAGLVVQESASATLVGNTIGGQPFGVSILTTGVVEVTDNVFDGPDVGLQLDESSAPTVTRNTVRNTTAVGIAHAGASAGTFTDNRVEPAAGVGVLVERDAAPAISNLSVDGGELGVAYSGDAGGTLSDTQLSGHSIGAQFDDNAAPQLTAIRIMAAIDAGVVVRSNARPTLDQLSLEDFGEVGIAVADDATPTFTAATVVGGRNGASFVGASRATLVEGEFRDVEVGVQVGESATPSIEGNEIISPTAAGIVFIDEAQGEIIRNTITDPMQVGIQLGGEANPQLIENVLFLSRPPDAELPTPTPTALPADDGAPPAEGGAVPVEEAGQPQEAQVGMLFAEDATGVAESNQIIGFVIGVQVGDNAAPILEANTIDGGVWLGVAILYRDDASGRAQANESANHGVGIQISDRATPVVVANVVERVRDVAILVQGRAEPVLEENFCAEGVAGIGLLDDTDPERRDNDCVEVFG